jgi:hypothetical protein
LPRAGHDAGHASASGRARLLRALAMAIVRRTRRLDRRRLTS